MTIQDSAADRQVDPVPGTPTPPPEPPTFGADRVWEPTDFEVVDADLIDSPEQAEHPSARRRLGGVTVVSVVLALAAAVAIAGVAFAIGRTTAQNVATTGGGITNPGTVPNGGAVPGFGDDNGGAGLDRGREFGFGGLSGTVTAINGDQLTVKLANGQTVTVALGSSTTYHTQATASQGDLATGQTVTVQVGRDALGSGSTTPTATDVTITGK
jgi:hypothetical protein